MPGSTGKDAKVVRKREMPKSGSAVMRPRARLVRLIGDELISDEPVALVELVKNAYDADATEVEVRFEGRDLEDPERIVIKDNGHGMDLDTVIEGWFEIGTEIKRENDTSPDGRVLLGEKGMGRFAAARLAETLVLETKKKDGKETIYVTINWGDFDKAAYLDEIRIDYKTRRSEGYGHGTRLLLEGLRKGEKRGLPWTKEDYEAIQTRLSRLISPFKEDKSDFSIELVIPGHSDLTGKVEPPEILYKPRYSLVGSLDAEGNFNGKIKVTGKRQEIVKISKLGGEGVKPLCGTFEVEIRAWDRDPGSLHPLVDKFKMGISEIRKILNDYSGVSIYRDGFRVYPYGQKGNDWLNLDIRSRLVPVRNLANNQIVAAIRISRMANPGLRDQSSREGLIQNPEYLALQEWFSYILSVLEERRYAVKEDKVTIDRTESLYEAFDLTPVVNEVRKELGKVHKLTKLVENAQKEIKEAVKRVQELYDRLLMMAGIGHTIDVVTHEIGTPANLIDNKVVALERIHERLPTNEEKNKAANLVQAIKSGVEQLRNFRDRIKPMSAARRGKAYSFDVREEVDNVLELFDARINEQKIKCEIIPAEEPIKVRMSKASFLQIMVNLLDNAIYWLVWSKGKGEGGRIKIEIDKMEKGFAVTVADNGPGVPENNSVKIFEPYFSTKRGGAGIGLGLYIARLLIEPYGKLTYEENYGLPGACFRAEFGRRVGL